MLKIENVYMSEALTEAQKAFDEDEVPVGAVIVFKNKIIARAHNDIVKLKDPTAHAEMIAITQASNYLKNERLGNCSIYVTIEPCAMCAGALILARIEKLIYGADDPKSGAAGSVMNIVNNKFLNHRIKVKKGILKEESGLILKEFFREKRKKV